ncbi:hypothetical protein [Runella zeae]|uniref:hypothetical protein n=2 Tax=Runella zeae TaxID=94255 RepID=UPI00048F5743|nr:hypothetical protein [Runella zeae]
MKMYIKYAILAAIFLLFSCHQEPTFKFDFSDYDGEIEGMRNGKKWEKPKLKTTYMSYCSPLKNTIGLYFITNTSFTDYLEWLDIIHIPTKVGTYLIEKEDNKRNCNTVSSICNWMHYDQRDATYDVVEINHKPNQVTITSVDTVANTIRGHFNVSLVVSYKYYKVFPDNIQVSGSFRSPISSL